MTGSRIVQPLLSSALEQTCLESKEARSTSFCSWGACFLHDKLYFVITRNLTCEKLPSLVQIHILLDTSVCKQEKTKKTPFKKEIGIHWRVQWLLWVCYNWWKKFSFTGLWWSHNPVNQSAANGRVHHSPSTLWFILSISLNRRDERMRRLHTAISQQPLTLF